MIRFIYNLLWPLGLLLFLPRYLRKMFRRGGYRRNFGQRFAIYDSALRQRLRANRVIWLHAVSVGEVAIALKLARVISRLQPTAVFALTTTTTTAFAFARSNAPSSITVMYSPLDFWPIMRRAFDVIHPERILLVEAEVWPNFVAEASNRKVPVALVNARLSARSERRFRRFRTFVAPLFQLLDLVCVPERADVERWASIGVPHERLRYTGSIKYDPDETNDNVQSVVPASYSIGQPDRPVLFGGSTHYGEEVILARIFLQLRRNITRLLLFLAPRHVERAAEVKQQLDKLSLDVTLCSQLNTQREANADCYLLDRTGELRQWYSLASVVFVGKSLTAIGGQNPVEPIGAGKPVMFGPHMENFGALARELVENGGAIQVDDEESLSAAAQQLLCNPQACRELVENARRVIDAHRGATLRSAELVLDLKKSD